MQSIVVNCPGCRASLTIVSNMATRCTCCYCGAVFLLRKPIASPGRELKVHFNKIRTPGRYSKDVHIGSYIFFAFCVVVTAAMAFFAVRILLSSGNASEYQQEPPYQPQMVVPWPEDEEYQENGAYIEHEYEGTQEHPQISEDPPMTDIPDIHYFGLHAVVELYPFRVAIIDIQVYEYEYYEVQPYYGNIYVWIALLFDNISEEEQELSYTQVHAYVDNHYVTRSTQASDLIQNSLWISPIGGSIAPQTTLLFQHAVEIPIGTTEIVVAVNDSGDNIVYYRLGLPSG